MTGIYGITVAISAVDAAILPHASLQGKKEWPSKSQHYRLGLIRITVGVQMAYIHRTKTPNIRHSEKID